MPDALPSSLTVPRALLFDWDNTLVDTWPVIHEANNLLFEYMGRETWTLEETKRNVRKSLRDSFPEYFGDRWEEARDYFYAVFKKIHLEKLTPISDAEEALIGLHETGLALGIVSNKNGPALVKEVRHLGWEGFFRACAGAGDAPKDKPAPEHAQFVLDDMGGFRLGPDIWYIGDTDIDMELAHTANMTGILIGGDYDADPLAEWRFPPHVRLSRLSDLLPLVVSAIAEN